MKCALVLRPPVLSDTPILIAGRDEAFRRFIGPGSASPEPSFVIVLETAGAPVVIGWIDYERGGDQTWLGPGEVNVGYNIFAAYRARGFATAALHMLLRHLATQTAFTSATLTIAEDNAASLRVAERAGFAEYPSHKAGSRYFKRPLHMA